MSFVLIFASRCANETYEQKNADGSVSGRRAGYRANAKSFDGFAPHVIASLGRPWAAIKGRKL